MQAPLCVLDLLLDRLSTQVCWTHTVQNCRDPFGHRNSVGLFQICPGSPPGVWVCSTDMILTVPPDLGQNQNQNPPPLF